MSALGRKERTEAELAQWLRDRGVGEEDVAEVVARLVEAEAVDDVRFARRYAEDKRELRAWGPDRIAEALRARGVAEAHVSAALAAEDAEGVIARAVSVLRAAGAQVADERGRARALSLLARRGYPLEIAYDAVRVMGRCSGAA